VPGESIKCVGSWVKHPEFGRQFKAERVESVRPATVAAIEKYLGSGLVKGIGPATAKKIVARFGAETLDVLDREPHRLHEIQGLGRLSLDRLTKVWEGQKAVQSLEHLRWSKVQLIQNDPVPSAGKN
jgi:exodeoxyribonuclease V alpha subunit